MRGGKKQFFIRLFLFLQLIYVEVAGNPIPGEDWVPDSPWDSEWSTLGRYFVRRSIPSGWNGRTIIPSVPTTPANVTTVAFGKMKPIGNNFVEDTFVDYEVRKLDHLDSGFHPERTKIHRVVPIMAEKR